MTKSILPTFVLLFSLAASSRSEEQAVTAEAKAAAERKALVTEALKAKEEVERQAKETKAATVEESFRGLGFGAGIGAVFDAGGRDRVKSASVDPEGIVRVQSDDSVRVGAVLETHYLWAFERAPEKSSTRLMYHGPQVAAVLGDNVIDGIGVGYMLALRRRNTEGAAYALKSFNLGVGAMIQPSVQTLGAGLKENRPLPEGDQIRYKNEPKMGIYAVFSVGF